MNGRYYPTSDELRRRDAMKALWSIYDMAAEGLPAVSLQTMAWIAIERDGWAERHDAQPRPQPRRAEVA